MSYQIRKIQPAHRPQKPRWRLSKQHDARSLAKQLSSASTSINDSPERTKPKSKASIQTIMMAKSSYAEKLSTPHLMQTLPAPAGACTTRTRGATSASEKRPSARSPASPKS